MKTNSRAVRMLALAALLALLGGARAGVAGGGRGEGCGPDTTPPKITVNAQECIYFDLNMYPAQICIMMSSPYGEDIILHCSAKNSTHLEMKEDSKSLQIIEVNTTTVQFRVKKPNLGVHSYSCMDSETSCEYSLSVTVQATMYVESPRKVRKKLYNEYFVPLGGVYEVLCSGHDSEALIFEDQYGKVQAEIINRTCIKYRTQADRVGEKVYVCKNSATGNDVEFQWMSKSLYKKIFEQKIMITVDYLPECHNFSCILYDSKRVLECTWHYSSDKTSFQLFQINLTYGYEDRVVLCSDKSGKATGGSGGCTADARLMENSFAYGWINSGNFTLLLMSCNTFFCINRSFTMNPEALSKAYPFTNLDVEDKSSHGVTLRWRYDGNYNFKVEYRQTALDDDRKLSDMSSISCEKQYFYVIWEYELALPYPGAEYEVWVYARHEAATDDRLWSEPRYLLVTTEPRVEECACGVAPDAAAEPTTTISAKTASCELCTLTEYTISEGLALKQKFSSLKKKLANFNDYYRLMSKAKEITKKLKKFEGIH